MKKKFFLVLMTLCLCTSGIIPAALANPGKWVSSFVQNKKLGSSRSSGNMNVYTLASITNIGTAAETITVKFLDTNGTQITEMNKSLAVGAVWKFTTGEGGAPSGTTNSEGYFEVSTADNDASETLLPWAAIFFGSGTLPASAVSVSWAKR